MAVYGSSGQDWNPVLREQDVVYALRQIDATHSATTPPAERGVVTTVGPIFLGLLVGIGFVHRYEGYVTRHILTPKGRAWLKERTG
jgi:hypothetical protein